MQKFHLASIVDSNVIYKPSNKDLLELAKEFMPEVAKLEYERLKILKEPTPSIIIPSWQKTKYNKYKTEVNELYQKMNLPKQLILTESKKHENCAYEIITKNIFTFKDLSKIRYEINEDNLLKYFFSISYIDQANNYFNYINKDKKDELLNDVYIEGVINDALVNGKFKGRIRK